ncbi:MRN complex-interacting protein-like [Hydra vulgaris]|uniref:MRN complex-interacting protein-like n=1 Tax=Hydra vulgaris TaxID=6087 RepID=A0ABM4BVH8_HYDVU
MTQEFQVLQCYKCNTFQVNQVKKSTNKWRCKICDEKQSVRVVHFVGIAKDCRQHCQELNLKKGNDLEKKSLTNLHHLAESVCLCNNDCSIFPCDNVESLLGSSDQLNSTSNRWLKFCTNSLENEGSDDEDLNQFNVQMRKSSNKKRKLNIKKSYICDEKFQKANDEYKEYENKKFKIVRNLNLKENAKKDDQSITELNLESKSHVLSGTNLKLKSVSQNKQQETTIKSETSKWSRYVSS